MRLQMRDIQVGDFEPCWDLSALSRISPEARDAVRCGWETLLRSARMQGVVVEDLDCSDAAVLGFGVSAFGSEEAVIKLRTTPEPDWPAAFLASANGNTKILDYDGIARANAGPGLSLLVMQYGWPQQSQPETNFLVGDLLTRGFIECHRGYQLKEILQQMYGRGDLEYVTPGFKTLCGYTGHFSGRTPPPADLWPFLCGITLDEVRQMRSTPISTMFTYAHPVLRLSQGQQEALLLAIRGMPDPAIAAALKISSEALKQRWRAIGERVLDHPQLGRLLQDSAGHLSRRQWLVAYFKEHYEELRPYGDGARRRKL